jgi:signal transduction histidine kinase
VFSAGVRYGAVAYGAGAVALGWLAGADVTDQGSYLETWSLAAGLLVFPAIVFTALAAHRTRPAGEHVFWRRSLVAQLALAATGVAAAAVARQDVLGLRALSVPGVAVVTLLFMRAHWAVMGRRSGGRSIVLDAVETAIATVVLGGVLTPLIGDRVLTSPTMWFTVPAAQALIGGIIGTVWALALFQRTPHRQRRIEGLAIGLGVLAILDGSAHLAQGLSDFTLPASPLLALHQLTMVALLLVPLHASRCTVPGLERLSPHRQVRSSRGITILTIAAVPVLGGLAVYAQQRVSWAVPNFAVVIAALAILLAWRNLLALDETKRLYQQVEAAAAERQHLLGALSRSVENERHRVAAQLHQQAIASYATFAAFIQSASRASPSGTAPLPETSQRLQADLSRDAEAWRELMLAVRPSYLATQSSAERLAVATRAAVVSATADDAAMPALTVAIEDDLQLDWATEAVVLRIVQEAVTHANDGRHVSRLDLAVTPTATGVRIDLAADGAERPAGTRDPDAALAMIRSFVDLGGGELTVHRHDTGITIGAELGHLGPRQQRPPQLRVV